MRQGGKEAGREGVREGRREGGEEARVKRPGVWEVGPDKGCW